MKNFTRNLIMSIALCFALASADAQWVTIPDANFVSWLNTHGYAGCMNGNQLNTTCSAVINTSTINCSNSNIANLTGISAFSNLFDLYCQNNQLTGIPPLPTSLKILNCDNNGLFNLSNLPTSLTGLACAYNNLSSLPNLPSSLSEQDRRNQILSATTFPAEYDHRSFLLTWFVFS